MFKDLRVSITKMINLKKRSYVANMADAVHKSELERSINKIDTNPVACIANYLLGEDAAIKRMNIKDLIKWGYVQKPKIDNTITKIADAAICALMGYKVGVNIRCIKKTQFDSDELYRVISRDTTGFIIVRLVNGDVSPHACNKKLTPTQLVDGEWIVNA